MKQEQVKFDDGLFTGTCTKFSGNLGDLIEMIRKAKFGSQDKTKTWIEDLWDFLKTCKARAEEMERNQERYWEDFKMDYIHLESYLASLKEGNYQGGEDAAFCAFQAGILYERLLMRMASEHIRKRQKNLRVLKEGHESSYGTPEEKRLRWEAFRSAFENVSKDNPDWTRQACYESVAEQFDVSAKTIQRAVLAKKETS